MSHSEVVHYLIGSESACRKGEMASSDRAAVTCRRCISLMEAGAERPLNPYLPSGRKPIRRKPKPDERTKETMPVPGVGNVVLDASPYRLNKGFAGDPYP